MTKNECFRRINLCATKARESALKYAQNPDAAEKTVRGDLYVEELRKGDFRIRIQEKRIKERALKMGYGQDEAKHAISQYTRFLNDG